MIGKVIGQAGAQVTPNLLALRLQGDASGDQISDHVAAVVLLQSSWGFGQLTVARS